MLKGDWRRKLTNLVWAIILVGIVLDFGASTYINGVNIRHEYVNEQKTAHEQAKKASDSIAKECIISGYDIEIFRSCLMERLNTYIKQNNTSKDAQAQLDMAQWAFATFIVSAAGLLISTAGLTVVWGSLKQTREAITNDREIGQAQVRAYISVEPKRPLLADNISIKILDSIAVEIKNNGSSPARYVGCITGAFMADHPLPGGRGDVIDRHYGQPIPSNTIAQQSSINVSVEIDPRLNDIDVEDIKKNGTRRLYLVCRVFYKDVFDKAERETKLCVYSVFEMKAARRDGSRGVRMLQSIEWETANVLNDAT